MLIASFLFALMNVCVKAIGNRIPTIELVFFRGISLLLLSTFFIRRRKVSMWGKRKGLLIARAMAGTCGLLLFFYTLQNMPLASAVILQYLSPIFSVILAIFFLSERITFRQASFFLLSFAGVVLVKQFDFRISPILLLAGIGGAVFSGLAYNLVRLLRSSDHYLTVVFYFSVVSTVGCLPFMFSNWVSPTFKEYILLVAIGVFTYIAQVYMTKSYHAEAMRNVAGIRYLGVVYALVFGFFLFAESYDYRALLGMVLVVGGVIANISYRTARQPDPSFEAEKKYLNR